MAKDAKRFLLGGKYLSQNFIFCGKIKSNGRISEGNSIAFARPGVIASPTSCNAGEAERFPSGSPVMKNISKFKLRDIFLKLFAFFLHFIWFFAKINCMQIKEQEKPIEQILNAIKDKNLRVVGACAPSARVAMGEMFGLEVGLNLKGKLVTALKTLGFDDVFDLDFAADLTIMEESAEFAERILSGKNLPHLTSCCPAWVKYVEKFYPEFIGNLSTTKSPQQIFGAVVKTYYAEKLGVSPNKLFVVCIMPCLAKRLERLKAGINVSEGLDVDAVLTVRELGELLKQKNIDFANLKDTNFDSTFGMASGAGVIFGTSGGVLEASLRTLSEKLDKSSIKGLDYQINRGLDGIVEREILIGDRKLKVALASGLNNAKMLLDRLKAGEEFDFIEVMACPGGCVNGTGMPLYPRDFDKTPLVKKRAKGLFDTDLKENVRKAHDNIQIKNLYKTFLGEPNKGLAKQILHVKR